MAALDRRLFLLTGITALLPHAALSRRWRWIGAAVEAVLVGAVSGYVAARVAQGRPSEVLVESGWHQGDRLIAQSSFHAIEYPTEALVAVPAGYYEVKSTKVVDIRNNKALRVLTLKNHYAERYVGVAYAV